MVKKPSLLRRSWTPGPFNQIFRAHKIHVIALLAAGVFVGWTGFLIVRAPLATQIEVVVNEGQGVNAIADALKKNGVIENKFVFVAYTLITGNEKKLQAGRYIFKPGVIVPDIVHSMASGFAETDVFSVTIPEGFNVWEIDKRLVDFGLVKEGEFAKKYQPQEGQFFPDTYRFSRKGETADTIAEKMKNHLNLKFKELSLVFSSLVLEDTLTKASILEKEARREEDMRLVAGVIRNRLAKKKPLEIDATVAYGACLRKFKSLKVSEYKYCDVSQIPVGAEIRIDSPYNSYMRAGLPPGPIANPGTQAIQAALNPQGNYLYYLSTRDGSRLIFSKTAAEHAANRRKYLGL